MESFIYHEVYCLKISEHCSALAKALIDALSLSPLTVHNLFFVAQFLFGSSACGDLCLIRPRLKISMFARFTTLSRRP